MPIKSTVATVIATDGVPLTVYTAGSPRLPVVVAIHGYPDDHTVWSGVVDDLASDFHVVTYDVRGAGSSGAPPDKSGYRMPQLVDDLISVLDTVSPTKQVHLLAHDWGSIQSWAAVTDPRLANRIVSFTSVSGPSLDMAGAWLQKGRRYPRAAIQQLFASYYIGVFQLPALPELLASTGVLASSVRLSSRVARPRGSQPLSLAPDTMRHGINLYRANASRLLRPRPASTAVPVQVLAPTHDVHVSEAIQTQAPRAYAANLYTKVIRGNHWVVAQSPHVIARSVREFVDFVNGGPLPRDLTERRGAFGGSLAVITGGARGIGRATALELARKGADIVIADINDVAAKQTALEIENLGVSASAYHLDVSDAEGWDEFAAHVRRVHGVPDVLVNNAGIGMGGAFLDMTPADWERILGVNLWSVIHGSRLFGAQMVERGQGGTIVNIASAASFTPSRFMSAYATTKAAVLMLTECLRGELAGQGIGVTAICPGFVDSDISRTTVYVGLDPDTEATMRQRAIAGYWLRGYSPERLARHAVRAVEKNRAVAPIGFEAHLLRATQRFAPGVLRLGARVDASLLG